ncbi:hypothetical protein JB92DRAFT_2873354 [Gautieria morchelliformis]|nr:hypothetical protein JB92DRAFT_2873354 [Gautieria morchelliformis]
MGAEHPKPGIAFKISKECLDWSQPSRKQIADLFKARHTSICYLDDAALGARWKRLTSACSRNCVMDLVHVETYHTDTEGNKQSRPPELNLMARTKRGGAYTSNSRIGKRKRVEILSSTTSPPPQTPRGRPKPRPTYVGAEDDSGEPRGSCDRASERHGAPSSRRFILPNNGTPLSPGVNKPLVVKPSVAATSSSWDRLRVGSRGHSGDSIAETERLAKSKGRLMTELILDSEFAATETHAGTASEFLSRNHEEVRDALQQALHLLDNP